jgi:riboflavin biosynthesis pyrimidine reductase
MAELLAGDQVKEIRVCWAPRLKGGSEVLSTPFPTPDGLKMGFHFVRSMRFGDVLGVIYRRRI